MSNNLVIIPTYNEKENIRLIIEEVFSLNINFDILVVDDSSPDKTSEIVNSLQEKFPSNLFLLKRKIKNGLGRAYLDGFRWALKRSYDYIFQMDADFSHNPQDLVSLLNTCQTKSIDVSIGSRYINGITVINWPLGRILLSYFASKYVEIITNMPIKDSTAGFVCYSKKVLENIDLYKVKQKGYGFQIEMKYKSWKKGFKMMEIPIIFKDRELGESKLDKKIVLEAVFGVINLRWKSFIKTL